MEILHRPIFKVGKAIDGRIITEKEVKQVYENTKSLLQDGFTVALKLGHRDTDQIAKGWVKDVFFENNQIFADFVDMDLEIYQAVNSGKLPNVSVEITSEIEWNGKTYQGVISAVALLGIDTPALFFENNKNGVFYFEFVKNNIDDEKKMGNEIYEAKIKELENQITQMNVVNDKIDKYEAKIKEQSELIETYKKQVIEFEAKLKVFEAEKFETLKNAVLITFEKEVIEKGKINPSDKDKVIALFEAVNFDKEKCENLISTYKNLPDSILTKEFGVQTEIETKEAGRFYKQLGGKGEK